MLAIELAQLLIEQYQPENLTFGNRLTKISISTSRIRQSNINLTTIQRMKFARLDSILRGILVHIMGKI